MNKIINDFIQAFVFSTLVFIVFYIIFDLLSSREYQVSPQVKIAQNVDFDKNIFPNIKEEKYDNGSDVEDNKIIKNEDEISPIKNAIIKNKIPTKEINISQEIDEQISEIHKNLQSSYEQKEKKPKLVIIVDDVMFAHQVQFIKDIDLNLTPSFLTSIKNKKIAKQFTKQFTAYMIHLPLEAFGHKVVERNTIKTNSSKRFIQKQIKRAKTFFPKAKYLNNHTGSKFTSNIKSMRLLKKVLDKNNLIFLDSLTTKNSKAKIVFGKNVLTRNVFLDNEDDEKYIFKQIKKVIKIAKITKKAIAICHPRRNTLKALKTYSSYIKKYVDVVFITNYDK